MALSASARFRLRVREILDTHEVTQKSLRVGNSEGWISNKIAGRRMLQLDEAEDIAAALQRPLSEMIQRADHQTYELDNLESRLIEAFRQLTRPEQDAMLTLITLRQRPAPYAVGRKVERKRGRLPHGAPTHSAASAPDPVQTALAAIVRRLDNLQPGQQDATPSADRPGVSATTRTGGRSDPK